MQDTQQQEVVDRLEVCVDSLMGVIARDDRAATLVSQDRSELGGVIAKLKLTINKIVEGE